MKLSTLLKDLVSMICKLLLVRILEGSGDPGRWGGGLAQSMPPQLDTMSPVPGFRG